MRYDVFISYAREDSGWVRSSLYEPLVRCHTRSGERPKVFFDVSREGVPPAVNFQDFLAEAIPESRAIILVYSSHYFSKPMCNWEMSQAFALDPAGATGRIVPLLLDARAADAVPRKMWQIHYTDVALADWFERLCDQLGLTAPQQPPEIRFLDTPGDVVAGHTLPAVHVELVRDGRRIERPDPVTISLERGELRGTATVPAEGGVATFADLSLRGPVESTRLIASSEGSVAAFSAPFAVAAPPETQSQLDAVERDAPRRIDGTGRLLFFDDESALLVLGDERADVFGLGGDRLASFTVGSPVRVVRRAGDLILLGTWAGMVHLASSAGRVESWDLRAPGQRYSVPGDGCVVGDHALVGLWNGDVYRLRYGEAPERTYEHPRGVQVLACGNGVLFVGGLDGSVLEVGSGRSRPLEPTLRLLVARPSHLLAVGEDRLYRIPRNGDPVLSERPRLAGIRSAGSDAGWPAAIDASGKGVMFDDELNVRATFHVGASASLEMADRAGRFLVVRDERGEHALVAMDVDSSPATGRIVVARSSGIAVGPSGHMFAFADARQTRIVDRAALDGIVAGQTVP